LEWEGEPNVTKREFDGLMRMVAGYVPFDLSGSDMLEQVRQPSSLHHRTAHVVLQRNLIRRYRDRPGYDLSKYCDVWEMVDLTTNVDVKMRAMEEASQLFALLIQS
jgi:hypothetical protein